MIPPTLVRPRDKPRKGRLGDNVERCALTDVARGAINSIKDMGAATTRRLALGPIHEAVKDKGVVLSEQV